MRQPEHQGMELAGANLVAEACAGGVLLLPPALKCTLRREGDLWTPL